MCNMLFYQKAILHSCFYGMLAARIRSLALCLKSTEASSRGIRENDRRNARLSAAVVDVALKATCRLISLTKDG